MPRIWLTFIIGLILAGTSQATPFDNAACFECHATDKQKILVPGGVNNAGQPIKQPLYSITPSQYTKGVHGGMTCIACHVEITDARAPHQKKSAEATVTSCPQCHQDLWQKRQAEQKADSASRLATVAQNIETYKQSFHAKPDDDNRYGVNATCTDCHNTHTFNVPAHDTRAYAEWRKTISNLCGKCHEDEQEDYSESVHGQAMLERDNKNAPACSDCHNTHDIGKTSNDQTKLAIVKNCGDCHKEQFKTYRDTYHGQINHLGYAYTAKCFDCHGGHNILKVTDPDSRVSKKNRLKTCMKCHTSKKKGMHDATEGFLSFDPHANSSNFVRDPQLFIATWLMDGLLIFVFAFFWIHSSLWYYREWRERCQGKQAPHIDTRNIALDQRKHFLRFHWGWRIAHLCFALATMTLVLTGTTTLFAQSSWAPVIVAALGGPQVLKLIHHIAAPLFIGIFIIHFIFVMQKLLRDKNFRWFGPDSLIPNWKDFTDCRDMFKWFVGKGPRPLLDRWTYYEKFDYWAVFWGINIIGWSGLILAFPYATAQYLPGWIFNVATLIHGKEAFLAAVFLFTVHFFNNHFRPDKLPPPDIVMFTGTQSLEEFRRDHPAQYQRLLDTGELQKHLVDAPPRSFRIGSAILGLVLIAIGLILLVLVTMGFFGR